MRAIRHGSADQSTRIRILDADGMPATGVAHDTAGLSLWYHRTGGAKVPIAPAALAAIDSAHSDGGIVHIGDGYYRLDLPDAACAAGAADVATGGGVTGGAVVGACHPLVAYDAQDAAALGLSRLDAAIGTRLAAADYTGPDNAGIGTLLARLTAERAGLLDLLARLDAEISTRLAAADYTTPDNAGILAAIETRLAAGAYTSPDNAGIGTLLARLTAERAGLLDLLARLDVDLSTRLAAADYTAPDNAGILAAIATRLAAADYTAPANGDILMAIDLVLQAVGGLHDFDPATQPVQLAAGAIEAATITAAAARLLADHVLRRGAEAALASDDGDAPQFRSLLGAVSKLVNRVGIAGGNLVVYRPDDATPFGTQAVATDPEAEPIVGVDTV